MENLGTIILRLYVTVLPVIVAGILTMFVVKLGPRALRRPLDGGKRLSDGQFLFGKNKTYLGLLSYLITNVFTQVLWGALAKARPRLEALNYLYTNEENSLRFNIIVGLLFGLAYALFELPNSFLKRRLGIAEGKPAEGNSKILFTVLDQIDSIVGIGLVIWIFYLLGLGKLFLLLFLGFFTHAGVNFLLYLLKLRKNPL